MTFPRYMYAKEGTPVLVNEEKNADGLFIKPPHKWAKDEKPFEVKKAK